MSKAIHGVIEVGRGGPEETEDCKEMKVQLDSHAMKKSVEMADV
jgi:hypothetical protein